MNILIQALKDSSYDVIGDIHGEYEALLSLLFVLGYDTSGNHPEGRIAVFAGDLVDRGPNSVAVAKHVASMVSNGNAQCVLGNHELNILMDLKRDGNAWFFGPHEDDDGTKYPSVVATNEDREMIIDFFKSLPIALENDKLRVVHACWDKKSIDTLRKSKHGTIDSYLEYRTAANEYLLSTNILNEYENEQETYFAEIRDKYNMCPRLTYTLVHDMAVKDHNPIKVVTSGVEEPIRIPFFAGGKWRFLDRSKWWDSYEDDIPVIVGHYWRTRKSIGEKGDHDMFKYIRYDSWFGKKNNVFCVDYSVGRRYNDRKHGYEYMNRLSAMRFPERILVDENGTIRKT